MTKNSERAKVLMVDDDPDFQTIVRDWIAPKYDHIGLSDGSGLLDEIESLEPNLVIMDVRMPGLDGFKLGRRIRSDSRFTDIPIVFLTGCKEDEDFFKNLRVGGTAYLTKPVTRRRLLSVIREVLQDYAKWA